MTYSKLARLLLLAVLATGLSGAHALDINRATAEELTQLKGVGPKRAADIVRYREQHGPIESVDQLLSIPGIGPKVLDDNAELIELPTQPRPSATKNSSPQ